MEYVLNVEREDGELPPVRVDTFGRVPFAFSCFAFIGTRNSDAFSQDQSR